MSTLKERLMAAPDAMEKCVKFPDFPELGEVKIGRMSVAERDEILKDNKSLNGADDFEKGSSLSKKIILKALLDPITTEEELNALPAFYIDKIAEEIMDFNGWTIKGRRSLEDQFRTTS